MNLLTNIRKIIMPPFDRQLKRVAAYSVISLLLDFIGIIILIPIFISIFNGNGSSSVIQLEFINPLAAIIGVVIFFIFKNLVGLKVTKLQSLFYFRLSNALSVALLKNYFAKSLLEVKSEPNSALVKDIVFVPNNFVSYVLSSIVQICSDIILLLMIFGIAVMISLNGAIFLAIIAVMIILLLHLYDKTEASQINDNVSASYNRNFNNLINAVNGYAEIKINGLENYFLGVFGKSNHELNNQYAQLTTARLAKSRHTETLLIIVIACFAIWTKTFGKNSAQQIVFASFMIAAGIKILPSINRILIGITNIRANLYTVDILSGLSKSDDKVSPSTQIQFTSELELKNISLEFEKKSILSEINIKVAKGKRIGLLGESGAGKSSLVNMISGLIEPKSGEMLCDGIPITKQNCESWQLKIAYVPQSPFIFEGTIKENLLPGECDHHNRLQELLIRFELSELIDSLPQKMDTFIGSNGFVLSGGQIQRMAIIRALLREPELLILDESTNQLDQKLREKIIGQIANLSIEAGMTVIAVSHQRSELERLCDEIYELSDGNLKRRK